MKKQIIKSILFTVICLLIITFCFSIMVVVSLNCDEVMAIAKATDDPARFIFAHNVRNATSFVSGAVAVSSILIVGGLLNG